MSRALREGLPVLCGLSVSARKPRVPHCEERPGAPDSSRDQALRCFPGPVDAGEEPVFVLYLDNQVNKRWTIDGVNRTHFAGDFVHTHFISYWRVVLHSPKFNCSR